ncbi:SdpI family protein [Desulforamulus aquiferis]|uniref:SdpI family protein n=2 Tax=Desulforamulus aquiferis TaxID=1397668 RepID=A0AAW7ZGS6_9FIRM|nr:SdpI family protein [Desulforamulus aquiferis]
MTNQNKIKLNWLTVIILIIFWGVCASFYPYLPDQVPTHWNIKGEVDNYSHKSVAAFILPLLPLGIYLLMTFIPKIDPKKENYLKFASSYEKIRLATVALMVVLNLFTLLVGLGYDINISLMVRIAIPLLIIVIGNYMGKVRYNYTLGFRLPWTLASEEVWNKTHRLGGKLMVAGGLVALLGVFTPPSMGFALVMVGILLPIVVTTVYSFLSYQKLRVDE